MTDRKPNGYWTKENTIKEAKLVLDKHGPEAITSDWLCKNGCSSLATAIVKHGGYSWIRKELGLEEALKPAGFWTRENTIKEARLVLDKHGPEAIKKSWLRKNGYSSLAHAITKHGGFSWIREELDLEESKRPDGFWTKEKTIEEARLVLDKHGPEAINSSWLRKNGYGGLAKAISKHGGYSWIREELGLEESFKPNGFWTKEQTIEEARLALEKHGPEAINQAWLFKNGYGGLANAINRHGGFSWIREELGLEEGLKPAGFWTKENTIKEAKLVLEKHGPEAINQAWLYKNGYSSLAYAIIKHGGFAWIREELGLEEGCKPAGFWTKENTIKEAKLVLEKHGPEAIKQAWLCKNGYSSLATAVTKHGGYSWIREELGIDHSPHSRSDRAQLITDELLQIIEALGDHIETLSQVNWLRILKQSKSLKLIGEHSALQPIKIKLLSGEIKPNDIIKPAPTEEDPEPKSKFEEQIEAVLGNQPEDLEESPAEPGIGGTGSDEDPVPVDEDPDRVRELLNVRPRQRFDTLTAAASVMTHEQSIRSMAEGEVERQWAQVFHADEISPAAVEQLVAEIRSIKPKCAWAAKVRNQFLADWRLIEEAAPIPGLALPKGWRLNLMQRREVALLQRDRRRLNISGMGGGKTLSAIAGLQAMGCAQVLVMCPNNAINSAWIKSFNTHLPAAAHAVKTWAPEWQASDHPRWVVNNHEMLCDKREGELTAFLDEFKPDALVVDELHQCKVRHARQVSQRHRNLKFIAEWCRNNGAAMYGMTGTLVTNEPTEALGLIEMIRPDIADELRANRKPRQPVEFCMAIHEAIQPISSRYVPEPPAKTIHRTIEVRADHLIEEVLDACDRSLTGADAVMVAAKLPALVNLALEPGKLLVFTSAVTDVVEPALAALHRAGIKALAHTGEDKGGSDDANAQAFINDPAVKVLIASTSTLSTGFDGLQFACNRIAFLTLPWTSTEKDQAEARVLRRGITAKTMERTVITASLVDPISGEEWSLDHQRLELLTTKRSMNAAVSDGVIPDSASIKGGLAAVRRAHGKWVKQVRKQLKGQKQAKPVAA